MPADPNGVTANAGAVLAALEACIDPEKARFLPRFFRTGPGEYGEGGRFLGVTVPRQRQVARRFAAVDRAAVAELLASGGPAVGRPFHEARLTGLLMLRYAIEKFAPDLRRSFLNSGRGRTTGRVGPDAPR